jgi:serine/threonine-protein kinase
MSDSERAKPDTTPSEPAPRRHDVATIVQLPTTVVGERSASPEDLARLLQQVNVHGDERLQFVAKMAEGGMGQIHLAVDHVLHRRVAKKVIAPDLKDDPLHARMFVREAQIVSQLDHPSIVPVHDMGVDEDGMLFFTMKLVRGRTLQEMIRELPKGAIQPAVLFDLLEIVVKVCDALSLAHSRGVIHCDVKPANIMVGDYGEVYLMDWGVAQLVPDSATHLSDSDAPVQGESISGGDDEEAAVSLGTLGYMSPEQIACGELTPATDIFCLGGVLYEIVTRKAPYSGTSMATAITLVQEAKFKPPEEVVGQDQIPPGLRRLIMTAMSASPQDRFSSAAAFKEELLRFMRGDGAFERQTFAAGEVIVMEGDAGNCAYIIESGHCDVFRVIQEERVTLGVLGPGDVFGEMAILAPGPRTANVVASEDVVAQVVDGNVLKRELDSMRPWMGMVVRRLATRLREDGENQTIFNVSNAGMAQQVMMYLCTWGQRGAGRTLRSDLDEVVRALQARTGADAEQLLNVLGDFPGLQVEGTPPLVIMRDPHATLGALWRADEIEGIAGTASHRELAEQIVIYLCTWGQRGPGRHLSALFETLVRELSARIGGDAGVLRAAIADYPELSLEGSPTRLVLAEPKHLLERLWPPPPA